MEKEYLVTYYFTNKEVYAIRYYSDDLMKLINKIINATFVTNRDKNEIVNMNSVCRFTINEIDEEEQ